MASSHRSHDLVRVTAALLASSEGGGLSSWRQLAGVLADRSLMEMEATMAVGDALVGVWIRVLIRGGVLLRLKDQAIVAVGDMLVAVIRLRIQLWRQ